MSTRVRELLERARAAEKLDHAASQRISDRVLEKLARGESALPGIDVAPVVLPKLSWWSMLFSGSGLKSIVLLGAGIASVATFAALRTPPTAESHLIPQDAPAAAVEAAAPAPSNGEPSPAVQTELAPPPAQVIGRSEASAHAASTRTGSASKKEAASARARAKAEAKSTRAMRVSAAAADVRAPAQANTAEAAPAAESVQQAKPKVAAASGQLDAELGLLRRAYHALHASKPAEAQALLDEHTERFPHGALEEPREVAHMIVLCKMGRDRAARVRADSFLALHPKSPFVPRVRSICSDNKD